MRLLGWPQVARGWRAETSFLCWFYHDAFVAQGYRHFTDTLQTPHRHVTDTSYTRHGKAETILQMLMLKKKKKKKKIIVFLYYFPNQEHRCLFSVHHDSYVTRCDAFVRCLLSVCEMSVRCRVAQLRDTYPTCCVQVVT